MRSACSEMRRKNSRISAGSRADVIVQEGDCRALDRGQGGAQLVAYHAHEFGAQPLHFSQRRHVLQGDDNGFDFTLFRVNGCGVDQCGNAAAVGDLQDDLFETNDFSRAQCPCQGDLFKGNLASVCAAAGYYVEKIFQRSVRHPQTAGDSCGLSIE